MIHLKAILVGAVVLAMVSVAYLYVVGWRFNYDIHNVNTGFYQIEGVGR